MRPVVLFVTICLFLTTHLQADPIRVTMADAPPVGNLSFVTLTATEANTGNVNTATAFTLGSWTSTFGTGVFSSSLPVQSFCPVSFNVTSPTSLDFSSAPFGTFASSSLSDNDSPPGFRNETFFGHWTPGTDFAGLTGGPFESELDVTLTQTIPGAIITATGNLVTPPRVAVSDGGMTLMLLGAALVGLEILRRRARV